MSEYIVTMRVEYSGAQAFITADSAEEARRKARDMQWHDFEMDCAEMVNWDVQRIEENGT